MRWIELLLRLTMSVFPYVLGLVVVLAVAVPLQPHVARTTHLPDHSIPTAIISTILGCVVAEVVGLLVLLVLSIGIRIIRLFTR